MKKKEKKIKKNCKHPRVKKVFLTMPFKALYILFFKLYSSKCTYLNYLKPACFKIYNKVKKLYQKGFTYEKTKNKAKP